MNIDQNSPKDPAAASPNNSIEFRTKLQGGVTPQALTFAPDMSSIKERLAHALMNFRSNDTIEFSPDVAFENGYVQQALLDKPIQGKLNYKEWGTNEYYHGALMVGTMKKISLSDDFLTVEVDDLKYWSMGSYHDCKEPRVELKMSINESTSLEFRMEREELMVVSEFKATRFISSFIPGGPRQKEASGYVLFGRKWS